MYAIAFDIDTKAAEARLGPNWSGCYRQIETILTSHGFSRMQGSLYFGTAESNAITCWQAVQELDRKFEWFGKVVRDLRMLRIDEDNDLLPILDQRLRLDGPSAANAA